MGVETPNVAGLDGDEALDIVDSWLSDVDGRYSGVREWAWLLVMPELKGPPQQ